MNVQILEQHLRELSYVYQVYLDKINNKDYIGISKFNLPPGYNYSTIPVLVSIPRNYPTSPPGVGDSSVYVPKTLLYKKREPTDFHKNVGPTKEWSWWCYEHISWNPYKDNLITFFELLRAHMTNPPVKY